MNVLETSRNMVLRIIIMSYAYSYIIRLNNIYIYTVLYDSILYLLFFNIFHIIHMKLICYIDINIIHIYIYILIHYICSPIDARFLLLKAMGMISKKKICRSVSIVITIGPSFQRGES